MLERYNEMTKQFKNMVNAIKQLRHTIDSTQTTFDNALWRMFKKSSSEQDHNDFLDKIKDRME